MKNLFRLVVIAMCISALLSLFGCKKEKNPFMLDGPGMINPYAWNSFDITRSGDSYAQHNFYINVNESADGYVVTGTVDGYCEEEGILLSKSDSEKIFDLDPGYLPDLADEIASGSDTLATVLDAPKVSIQVEYYDGRLLEKADEDSFSIKVYEIVQPYFEEKYNKN